MTGTPLPGTNSDTSGMLPAGSQSGTGTENGASTAPPLPVISTPKGGGAIKGIGEKFGTNPVNGTATMSVPIQLSPGRSGFGPSLSLSYDSGNGNGVWGLGWALNTPAIRRKTDKGLPRYADANESDVFLISGAEDLVPVLNADGTRHADTTTFPGFDVHRYRPRIEGLFARIERWVDRATGETHWRSISRDNVTTLYGRTPESRIEDGCRTFEWLICESHDDRGNAVVYEYVPEDDRGVDPPLAGSSIRDHVRQRYLKRIHYGNRTSRLVSGDAHDWMFEVVFDYAEGHLNHRPPAPAVPLGEQHRYADASTDAAAPWPVRPDPFSAGRAGFEVRTHRRCTGILMFHRIPDLGPDPYLVRSTEFDYGDMADDSQVPPDEEMAHEGSTRIASFLMSVTQSGYLRQLDGGYLCRGLPPVEFRYSKPVIDQTVHTLDEESLRNLPIGLDGQAYQWVDLDGVGLPGVLSAQNGAWYWKANLGSGRLGATAPLRNAPAAVTPGTGRGQLLDLRGDGRLDATVLDGPSPGFSSRTDEGGWTPYRTLRAVPAVRHGDPNLRFVDLTGDGLADILVAEAESFTWYPSLGEDGFAGGQRVAQPDDAGAGPRLVFADGEQAVYLADMTGDGLADMVRIRNGQVAFWPSLGRGRFGSRIVLRNSPWFDCPEAFDQRRIRLADVDGSNTTDITYLGRDGARLYANQSGNRLMDPVWLRALPPVNQFGAVQVADLLGNGTACLVWSSPMPADARTALRYVDLMGGAKPHLLIGVVNNRGSEIAMQYTPSTRFYLDDLAAGQPWATRLPFPVHCVSRVETIDRISGNRFISRYRYAHGYFDGFEREFRGFGMVEQWDTEEIAALTDSNVPADNIAQESNIPPVHTKTWFHTGVYRGRDHVSDYFAGLLNADDTGEYFREPGLTDVEARDLLLPDTILPTQLTLDEEQEACRALKGSMLRQEVYADDAGSGATAEQVRRARTPYTVTEQNFTIRTVQSRGSNRHAVFFTHAQETISYHYERNPADPRIQHSLTLEIDAFGNVLKQAAIGYGRRKQIRVIDGQGNVQQVPNPGLTGLEPSDQAKQTTPLITYAENAVTNAIETSNTYRTPLPCEALTFELTGYTPTGEGDRFQASDLVESDPIAADRLRHRFTDQVSYEAAATNNPCRRPIEWLRTLYRRDDLDGLLPLGELNSLALTGESYKLAFTPGLLTQVFQRSPAGQPAESLLPDPAGVLEGQTGNRGGYLRSQTMKTTAHFPATDVDDHWWIPSGQSYFTTDPLDIAADELAHGRQHFFMPRRHRDPFGKDAFIHFDANDLLPTETRDALGNRVTVEANDYRILQPRLLSDPNRNRTEVAFDVLGMVAGTAVMGKPAPAPAEGDTINGFVAELSRAQLDAFFAAAAPHAAALGLLREATTRIVYDLDRFRHTRDANPDDPAKWQPACAATIARETHTSAPLPAQGLRVQLSFSYSDGFGREIQKKIQAEPGPLDVTDPRAPIVNPRWVASGWTILNNKGKPVRQYEPFFSTTHDYEFGVMTGLSPVLFYDPTERVIATLHPNHTYEKVLFDPWQQTAYDATDSCAPRNQQTGDPRTDPDIQGYVAEYFKTQPATWQTWHAQRISGALGTHERDAAQRAAAHADTPITTHFDALGRPFLTLMRNRVVCPGHDLNGMEDNIATRMELDIEGNQRAVRDERRLPVNHLPAGATEQRIVMRYAYDMLGNRIHQLSMEAGARWMLNDVAGKPIRAWDRRGHTFTTTYDALRRPVGQTVHGTTTQSDPRTLNRYTLVDKIEYGEGIPNAEALNLRTRIYRHFDSAGMATNARLDASGNPTEAYDFKGNLLRSTRRLVSDYKIIPDWQLTPQLEVEAFEASTLYDALNRPTQSIAPHSSLDRAKSNIIQPIFNAANLLERVDVWLERATEPGSLLDTNNDQASPVGVSNVDYDAKGQRQRIDYKNDVSTLYSYDPLTFRLTQLITRRNAVSFPGDEPQPPITGWPGKNVQDLHYTYDPAGNITHIRDEAQQTIYFRNQRVEPSNDYTYDALYRLIQATGREHLGQNGRPIAHSHDDAGRVSLLSTDAAGLFAPTDGNAMGTYIERYVYDAVGNFLQMQHRSTDPAHPGWTRQYAYNETSLIEAGKQSNRLSGTQVGNAILATTETYLYDAHGNMVRMPHLGGALPEPNMHWNYKDQMRQSDLGGGGTAYYVYDASGQRLRKVWEKGPGVVEERIYLGGFEIFRRHRGPIDASTTTLERVTLHVMDDKQRIALVETRVLDSAGNDRAPLQLIRYQVGNHLRSTSLELDDHGQIISFEEYAPYGSSTYQAVRSQTGVPKRYRYTGKERDEESGLSYHGARYYAAWLGRWSSPDPAELVEGTNLFLYVLANPVRLADPSGRQSADEQVVSLSPWKQEGRWGGLWPQSMPPTGPVAGQLAQAFSQADAARNTGLRPILLTQIPGWQGTWASLGPLQGLPSGQYSGLASGVGVQQVFEGGIAAAIHFDVTGVQVLGRGQTSGELRNVITTLQTGSNRHVDVHIYESGQVSTIPRGSTQVVGAPLPERIAERLPNLTPPPAPDVPPTPAAPSGVTATASGSSGGPTWRTAGNTAANVGVQVVPGAAEGIVAAEAVGLTAARVGLPRLMAAALSGARAPGPAVAGGIVGAPAGYLAEGAAKEVGLGEGASVAVGTMGAVATGAVVAAGAVLLVATAPVSLTVLAGAAIAGGLAAGFGYLTSRSLR
jgi:RHS repeat-associated protein